MNIWPQFKPDSLPSARRRNRNAPLAFMHIPKSGGTSLIHALDRVASDGPHIRGFDRFTFGGFDQFTSIPPLMRKMIHLSPATLPSETATIFGHFALTTLAQNYPDADIITILREPASRLLSHWTYWRSLSWRQLRFWGKPWSARLKLATKPLAEFLSAPEIACQTDNIVTRMLLWPHPLIPDDGFIEPANDELILKIAKSGLQRFNFIDIAENGPHMMANFIDWYGESLPQLKLNATTKMPRRRQTRLNLELSRDTLKLIQQRTRLDTILWHDIAGRKAVTAEPELLSEAARLQMVARCSVLLS